MQRRRRAHSARSCKRNGPAALGVQDYVVIALKAPGVGRTSRPGAPLKIGPILGVFPELGRKLCLPPPYCDAVLGLLRQRAANSGL